jgi:hypothetical protein
MPEARLRMVLLRNIVSNPRSFHARAYAANVGLPGGRSDDPEKSVVGVSDATNMR